MNKSASKHKCILFLILILLLRSVRYQSRRLGGLIPPTSQLSGSRVIAENFFKESINKLDDTRLEPGPPELHAYILTTKLPKQLILIQYCIKRDLCQVCDNLSILFPRIFSKYVTIKCHSLKAGSISGRKLSIPLLNPHSFCFSEKRSNG